MPLYKRKDSPVWWLKLSHNGRRIQKSTGTTDRVKAQEYHDKLKAALWDEARLGVKPRHNWNEAVVRWLLETSHKATHDDDKAHLRWVDRFLRGTVLDDINRDLCAARRLNGSGSIACRSFECFRSRSAEYGF